MLSTSDQQERNKIKCCVRNRFDDKVIRAIVVCVLRIEMIDAVVRALHFRQCGPGSISGLDATLWFGIVGFILCMKECFFFGGGGEGVAFSQITTFDLT